MQPSQTLDILNYDLCWIKYTEFEISKVILSGCKDIGIRTLEFVAKPFFFLLIIMVILSFPKSPIRRRPIPIRRRPIPIRRRPTPIRRRPIPIKR